MGEWCKNAKNGQKWAFLWSVLLLVGGGLGGMQKTLKKLAFFKKKGVECLAFWCSFTKCVKFCVKMCQKCNVKLHYFVML